MRILIILIHLLLIQSVQAAQTIQVFVSFSMPNNLLIQTLTESTALHIPATLNGLYHNSMPETMHKILSLSKKIPNLALQIDPISFERYGIHQVPALVVDNGKDFNVIYGNLSLHDGLQRLASLRRNKSE